MAIKNLASNIVFRISLIASLLLLVMTVVLALTAVQVGENLKVVVQFFPTTKDAATLQNFSQLNLLSPIELKADKKLIEEMLMRHYMEMRYERIPDVREMKYRWGNQGPVRFLSTAEVYNEFAKGLEKKLEELPEVVQTIEIENVVEHTEKRFQVFFRIIETTPDGRLKSKPQEKTAVLNFEYVPGRRIWDPKLINPYGLVFNGFDETPRKQ